LDLLTIICERNWGSLKGLRRKLHIWVSAKMITNCNSNNVKKDFIGLLPLSWPPHKPSETIWGGASKQTVYIVPFDLLISLNKVSFEFMLIFVWLNPQELKLEQNNSMERKERKKENNKLEINDYLLYIVVHFILSMIMNNFHYSHEGVLWCNWQGK